MTKCKIKGCTREKEQGSYCAEHANQVSNERGKFILLAAVGWLVAGYFAEFEGEVIAIGLGVLWFVYMTMADP